MKYLWFCSSYFFWKPKTLVKIEGSNYYSILSIVSKLQKKRKKKNPNSTQTNNQEGINFSETCAAIGHVKKRKMVQYFTMDITTDKRTLKKPNILHLTKS